MASVKSFSDNVSRLVDMPKDEYFDELLALEELREDSFQESISPLISQVRSLNMKMDSIDNEDDREDSELLGVMRGIESNTQSLETETSEDDIYEMKTLAVLSSMGKDIEALASKGIQVGGGANKENKKGDDDDLGFFSLIGAAVGGLVGSIGKGVKLLTGGFKSAVGFILKPFKAITNMFGKASSMLAKPIKFMSNIAKTVTKSMPFIGKLGGLLKGLGKIAAPIAFVLSVFDGISGWNNADDITGKAENSLTVIDKIFSAISGIVGGLTFNLVDPKTIYTGIQNVIDFFSVSEETLSKVEEYLQLGWEYLKKLPTKVKNMYVSVEESIIKGVKGIITFISDFLFGDEGIFSVNSLADVAKNGFGAVKSFFGFGDDKEDIKTDTIVRPTQVIQRPVVSRNNTGQLMKEADNRYMPQANNAGNGSPIVINTPAQKTPSNPTVLSISDDGLKLINLGLME